MAGIDIFERLPEPTLKITVGPQPKSNDIGPIDIFERLPAPAQEQPQKREISFGEGLGRGAMNQYLENFLSLPRQVVEALIPMDPRMATMSREDVRKMMEGRRDVARSVVPTGTDVRAGIRAAGDVLTGGPVSGAFSRGQEAEAEADVRFQTDAPFGTKLGEATGDALTLLSGRLPIRASARKAAPLPPRTPRTGFPGLLDDIVNTKLVKSLEQGGIRVAEAGLESAMLAALQDKDPLSSAALAAGSQAGGSLMLTAAKETFGRGKLPGALLTGLVGIQLIKELTPGGKDRILESGETTIFKLLPLAALGAFGAFAGAGRVSGSLAKNLPGVADALTAIPRGTMQSVMRDLITEEKAGKRDTLRVLEAFTDDPDAFGPYARRRLEMSLTDGRRSISKEVETLMQDRRFRRKLEEISQ